MPPWWRVMISELEQIWWYRVPRPLFPSNNYGYFTY